MTISQRFGSVFWRKLSEASQQTVYLIWRGEAQDVELCTGSWQHPLFYHKGLLSGLPELTAVLLLAVETEQSAGSDFP